MVICSTSPTLGLGSHTYGTLITVLGVLILCPDTLLLRYVEDVIPWTVMFYRGLFFGASQLIYIVAFQMNPRRTWNDIRSLGYIGLVAGVTQGVSQVLFTVAVQNVAAANVLVINATNPIFSSLFSLLLLRETIPIKTCVVILICIAAILLVTSSDFMNQGADSSALGNCTAIGAAVTIGLYFVLVRVALQKNPAMNCLLFNSIAGLLMAVIALCIGGSPSTASSQDFGFLAAMGIGVLPISFSLLTIGPEYISAPEVSLYTLIETMLGPVFVYAGGFEAPPEYTIYGGVMLTVALVGHSALSIREEMMAAAAAARNAESTQPIERAV